MMHVAPACAGLENDLDHFGYYVCSLFMYLCKSLLTCSQRSSNYNNKLDFSMLFLANCSLYFFFNKKWGQMDFGLNICSMNNSIGIGRVSGFLSADIEEKNQTKN
jgi:hypothetical protein